MKTVTTIKVVESGKPPRPLTDLEALRREAFLEREERAFWQRQADVSGSVITCWDQYGNERYAVRPK